MRLPIAAKVNWLVCEETCIPQEVELGLVLPVVADAAQAGAGSPLIEQARAALPVNSPWPMRVIRHQDEIDLRVSGAELQAQHITDIYFFLISGVGSYTERHSPSPLMTMPLS